MNKHTYYPRLILLSQYFYPSQSATSQLITDLAVDLAGFYPNITILTSTSCSSADDYELAGCCVVRFSCNSISGQQTLLSKAVAGSYFLLRSLNWLLKNARNHDEIIAASNPPFIGVILAINYLLNKSKWHFILQDIFPASAAVDGIMTDNGIPYRILQSILRLTFRNATSVITLSRAMAERADKDFGLKDKLRVIPNWAVQPPLELQKELNPYAKLHNLDRVFTLQYCGNIGRMHEIITLLEAARLLQDLPFRLVFIGRGAKSIQVKKYIQNSLVNNTLLLPPVALSDLPLALNACDMAAITITSSASDVVAPSKFYGILQSGKPQVVVASHKSELAQLVSFHQTGIVADPGDPVHLAHLLRQIIDSPVSLASMSRNSRQLYSKLYGLDSSSHRYRLLLQLPDNSSVNQPDTV